MSLECRRCWLSVLFSLASRHQGAISATQWWIRLVVYGHRRFPFFRLCFSAPWLGLFSVSLGLFSGRKHLQGVVFWCSFNPRRSDTGVGFFSVDMAPGSQWSQVVEAVFGESLTAFMSSLDLCFTSRRRIGYLALLRW